MMVNYGQEGAMESVDSLLYSYSEQATIQLERLTQTIKKESDIDPEDSHRMFKFNPFDHIKTKEWHNLQAHLSQALSTLANYVQKKDSVMVVDRRHIKNFTFGTQGVIRLKPMNKVKFSTCGQRKASLMLAVVTELRELLEQDEYMTNRELYYKTAHLNGFSPQQMNSVLNDICCLLGCSRVHLRILSQSKGLIYGDLQFKLKNNETFNCLSCAEGIRLPTPRHPIMEIKSTAKCIIIVEKDSIFQKILKQEESTNFVENYNVILFTAKGYPDVNSRAFLNKLWLTLRIPVFVLSDADPHGMEIACCYKFGCFETASEASYLALPQTRWLGLLPSDVEKQPLQQSSLIDLTPNDQTKLKSLLKRPYLLKKPEWLNQLKLMREMDKKAELESLDILGDYLTKTFIPNKLRYASWL